MTVDQTALTQPGAPPTLDLLGGEDAVWAEADILIQSPLWFRVAESLLIAWDDLSHPGLAADFITRALGATNSPAVADDILDRLCAHGGYLQHAAQRLNSVALDRSRRFDNPRDAELAGTFLDAALRLALQGAASRYGLLDRLIDPANLSAPLAVTRRVVRALSNSYEQWRDPDLLVALRAFISGELHGDAAYELAMCHLADAFNAADRAALMEQFQEARHLLQAAIDADEERPDAAAYLAALDAVVAFDAGQTEPLRMAANTLRRRVTEHAMWFTRARTHWRDGRYDTEAAWYELSMNLEQADTYLDQPPVTWPSNAIGQILATYTADRSIRCHSSGVGTGLSLMIAPRIENAYASRQSMLHHLHALLAEAPPDWDVQAAEQLRIAVESQLESGRYPPALGGPGKASAAAYPALAAAIGEQILSALPTSLLDDLENQLSDRELVTAASLPVAQQEIFNEVIAVLNDCPDFRGAVRESFVPLVTQMITFLQSRTDRGRAHHTGRFAYLLAPAPGAGLPLENTLQEDLQDYLIGNLHNVDIELVDRSGGRADIGVRFPSFETIIECKRTKGKTTRTGLRRYLGQTIAYQAGGVTLGMLAVLDLAPKNNWIPNIRDNMWAERIPSPELEQRDRWAVVVRIPGNRITPHEM